MENKIISFCSEKINVLFSKEVLVATDRTEDVVGERLIDYAV